MSPRARASSSPGRSSGTRGTAGSSPSSLPLGIPQTAEGVALWLRRRVPGIGPAFARAIVDHFGAEHVFAELDRDPDRLREVRTKAGRAISRRAVERAIDAWREVAAVREVETFLFSHGLGAGLAARLVRTYGTDVIAVLEDDPYRLTEVPRIGFRVADRVARSLGIELDAPQRLRAGVLFVLTEAAGNGNVFLPLPELWPAAARLLEVPDADPLEAALVRLVSAEEIVVERERAYLAELWEAETHLAASLAERAAAPDDELFDPPARPERIEVSDEQWEIVELVRTRPLVLLTGLPGAGKTHTQRVVVELARRAGVRVLLCAPTGKAARRMRDLTGHDALTIHRALGYSPKEDRFMRDEDDPLSNDVELVIVDEASMLSLELADALFRAAGDATSCSWVTPTSCRRWPGPCARRPRRERRGVAGPPDRDLPPGRTFPHRPQRPPHQRRSAAVPLPRRGARRARRAGARRGLLLDRAQRPRSPA